MAKRVPFKHFKTSPEIIRLASMPYVRFPLSLRNVEDLLHERRTGSGRWSNNRAVLSSQPW